MQMWATPTFHAFGPRSSSLPSPPKLSILPPSPASRYSLHLRPSFLGFSSPPPPRTRSARRHVPQAGPPSPEWEPEPEDFLVPDPMTGLEGSLYKFQDGVLIFLSVLFWMSLFIWVSAWDGGDTNRLNKGSRFRL